MDNTRLKKIYAGIKQRCRNPKNSNFKHYGGRGIDFCKEWEDYPAFEKWAFNNGYKDELSIDRIDVNGNYEPSNCRWATREQQDNNRRDNVYEVVNGEKLTLTQIARKYGFTKSCIKHRYNMGDRGGKLITPLVRGVKRDGTKQKRKEPKFCERDSAEAKWLSLNSNLKQSEIADIYGMTQVFVSKMKLGHCYKYLEGVEPDWYKKTNITQRK